MTGRGFHARVLTGKSGAARYAAATWESPFMSMFMRVYMFMRIVWLVVLVAWSGPLAAQEFPNRTIKLIVPFPAGGPSDTIGRVLVDKMSSLLGQSMVIENRAGAGGLLGINAVAKSD